MKKTNLIVVLASLFVLTIPNQVMAAEPTQQHSKITEPAIFATVNGVNLSSDIFAFLQQSREQENDPEMQADEQQSPSGIKDKTAQDLIMTTLLAQQATKQNMHNSARFKLEMELFEQTLLAQLFVQQLMDEMQIEEPLIRKRYAEQPEQTLYRFMIWETPDAGLAAATLEALKTSGHPDTVNPQVTEVETPWLLGSDIDPEVQQAIVSLGMNDFIESPIYQDGIWKVVRLIDKRALAKQSYENERDIIRAEMVAEQLQEALDKLLEQATIIVNEDYSMEVSLR
ncbi:MAG: peptidylprolyl isomerase [Pseudomonas sp.]